jgi:hypothetical protein
MMVARVVHVVLDKACLSSYLHTQFVALCRLFCEHIGFDLLGP